MDAWLYYSPGTWNSKNTREITNMRDKGAGRDAPPHLFRQNKFCQAREPEHAPCDTISLPWNTHYKWRLFIAHDDVWRFDNWRWTLCHVTMVLNFYRGIPIIKWRLFTAHDDVWRLDNWRWTLCHVTMVLNFYRGTPIIKWRLFIAHDDVWWFDNWRWTLYHVTMVFKAISTFSRLLLVACYLVTIVGLYLAAFPGSSSVGGELLSLVVLPLIVGMVGVIIAADDDDFANVLDQLVRPMKLSHKVQFKIVIVAVAAYVVYLVRVLPEAFSQAVVLVFVGLFLTMLCFAQSAKTYWAGKIKSEAVDDEAGNEACNSIRLKDFSLRIKVTLAVVATIFVLFILGRTLEGWPDLFYLYLVLLYFSFVGCIVWGELEDRSSWYMAVPVPKVVLVGMSLVAAGWFFIPMLALSVLGSFLPVLVFSFIDELSDYIFLGAVALIATGLLIMRYANRCVVKHLEPGQPETVMYSMNHLDNLLSLVIYALAVLDGVLLSILYLHGDFDRFDYTIYLVAGIYIPVYLYLGPGRKLEAAGGYGRGVDMMVPVFYKAVPVVVLALWLHVVSSMLLNIS